MINICHTQIKRYIFIIYTDYFNRIGGQAGRRNRQNKHCTDKVDLSVIT
jgi:hypothetical protein